MIFPIRYSLVQCGVRTVCSRPLILSHYMFTKGAGNQRLNLVEVI
jgi:hypothetical protein